MRFSHLALAAVIALGSWPAFAEETASSESAPADASTQEAAPAALADESGSVPEPEAPEATEDAVASEPEEMELGPVGRDEHGHMGRIHVVKGGDTLWDISDAYLGTPWVWPSVWEDNEKIANPHLIYPGDHVWISPYDMRKITAAEAEAMMAAGDMPAAMQDPDLMPRSGSRPVFRYSEAQTVGFVTLEEIDGAAAIIDSTEHERTMLSDNTPVIIGLGANEVGVGDQFDIFRLGERVKDPETNRPVGYLTEELGWLEVTEVHDETATAMIKHSRSEMVRGDHLLPRRIRPIDIQVAHAPDVNGQVMHTPDKRLEMAQGDVLYLNRGTSHGLQIGSPLEVFRPMEDGFDDAQRVTKKLPDHVVAKMIVVDAKDRTAVAVVTHTTHELARGDSFRGTASPNP